MELSMTILSEAEVYDVLSPYHDRIQTIVERAWTEWRVTAEFRTKNNLGPVLYPRTMTNYVFDAIARFAIAEFADDSTVSAKVESQTVKFFFKGMVLGRFKKGDEGNLGQNITTQAVLNFIETDGVLPGMPPETAKVEFVWRSNELNTQLEHVFVVARDHNRLLWQYEIGGSAAGTGTVIPFPESPKGPADGADDDLVKPKLPAEKQEQDTE